MKYISIPTLIMGRHTTVQCRVCLKSFRSDKLKAHSKRHEGQSKYRMKTCTICQKTMIAGNLARHLKVHNNTAEEILQNMKSDQRIYQDIERTGVIVKEMMKNEDIEPMSLRREYQKALSIENLKKEHAFEALKPWQEQLLEKLEPSQRKIIWIIIIIII